jgi:hypothetical protein
LRLGLAERGVTWQENAKTKVRLLSRLQNLLIFRNFIRSATVEREDRLYFGVKLQVSCLQFCFF